MIILVHANQQKNEKTLQAMKYVRAAFASCRECDLSSQSLRFKSRLEKKTQDFKINEHLYEFILIAITSFEKKNELKTELKCVRSINLFPPLANDPTNEIKI